MVVRSFTFVWFSRFGHTRVTVGVLLRMVEGGRSKAEAFKSMKEWLKETGLSYSTIYPQS